MIYFIFIKNNNEIKQIDDYVEKVKGYYSSEKLIALPENGFHGHADFKKVNIALSTQDVLNSKEFKTFLDNRKEIDSKLFNIDKDKPIPISKPEPNLPHKNAIKFINISIK